MNPDKHKLAGLYAITDPVLMGDELMSKAKQAINAGVNILQYRNKSASYQQQKEEASMLATLCKKNNVTFIINDNVEIAAEVDADGVHIGQSDSDIQTARELLGTEKIIGVTCNNKIENAFAAEKQGADYVAFGRFFKSATKPSAPGAELSLLKDIHQSIRIPVVAIGGINHDNALQLLQYDIEMLAVIDALFGQDDIAAAVQGFLDIFKHRDDLTPSSAL